jgi:RNA-directed DNA polymerase
VVSRATLLARAMRRKNQVELNLGTGAKGEASSAAAQETEARAAEACLERPSVAGPSMEAVVERENLKQALAQVKRNKGAPGSDGMTVEALGPYLKEHWPMLRNQLLEGTYKPQPVRRVEIPKASGGMRPLGIPTVLDRFIQQAVMQVLQADWDPTFSETSFGFRPGRSAHQAVERAQAYIASGYAVVVDLDLEKFFDRVNHDILMGLVAKRVADKRLLKLIRTFLNAGVMEGGLVSPTEEGTPQGGPLSPLLSNLVLDVLDKELEKRGHHFVRYADDCNIYVVFLKPGGSLCRLYPCRCRCASTDNPVHQRDTSDSRSPLSRVCVARVRPRGCGFRSAGLPAAFLRRRQARRRKQSRAGAH